MIDQIQRNASVTVLMESSDELNNSEIPGIKKRLTKIPYSTNDALIEEQVGTTWNDLQSNGVTHRRIHKFDDGTISTVWTMGFDFPSFPDRGTGYNYFDGNSWGPFPTGRIESERTGWPSIAPWGENGEIVCSHTSSGYPYAYELLINRRENKGFGYWTEVLFEGPPNPNIPDQKLGILWPTMVTSGTDNAVIHLLTITAPISNGGETYYGQDGALLYSRSIDGGDTWDIKHHLFPELNANYYNFIKRDSYIWAEPQGDILVFLVTCNWMDAVLMKSSDGGANWTKTIIWEHPYPLFEMDTTVTDTFYCADNSGSIALDEDGTAHVVFGLTRLQRNGPNNLTTRFPLTDGIVYWNENMPGFSSGLNTLNPYGNPESELIEDYNLIGWTQDVNGDGEITFLNDIMSYLQQGISTMPQIVCGENDEVYLLFSSTTETFDNGIFNYKHIWARESPNNGIYWGSFQDMNSSYVHIFSECVFPSFASRTNDNLIYFTFQYMFDYEPGLQTIGEPWSENYIMVGDYVWGVGVETNTSNEFSVSEIQPNPADDMASLYIEAQKPGTCLIEILDYSGRKISKFNKTISSAGQHKFMLNIQNYNPGIYIIRITSEKGTILRKMIVQ